MAFNFVLRIFLMNENSEKNPVFPITTFKIFYTLPTDFKNETQMISELVLQHFLNETGLLKLR